MARIIWERIGQLKYWQMKHIFGRSCIIRTQLGRLQTIVKLARKWKKKDIPSNMLPLKQGQFNECMPQYPVDQTLNPDWSEPSNFCSNHGRKYYKISAAEKCV
jgi:hypothetical protein